ncbi:Uncharacterised protein [Mycobacteroides abscessus subsp. abscessus]|nr:Uncharacterised protein [Mycobacteroides abscessus subsp. abscessus]
MGWPPTNRCARPCSDTVCRTADFTLVTSVRGHSGASSAMRFSSGARAGTGTASTIRAWALRARRNARSRSAVAS